MQANAFAAELLMPKAFVLSAVLALTESDPDTEGDTLVRLLATGFAVSPAAMGYRLMNRFQGSSGPRAAALGSSISD